MQDDPFEERLRRLRDRVEAGKGGTALDRGRAKMEASALGWRMVTELVVGMLLGLAIGWGLDSLFGTRPAFLLVFAVLGFAAGVRTMMRTAAEARRKDAAGPAGDAGRSRE